MHASACRSFEAWTQARGNLSLPATDALVAEERVLSVASNRLHRAALVALHKSAAHEEPTNNEGVCRVLKGIARTHGKARSTANH